MRDRFFVSVTTLEIVSFSKTFAKIKQIDHSYEVTLSTSYNRVLVLSGIRAEPVTSLETQDIDLTLPIIKVIRKRAQEARKRKLNFHQYCRELKLLHDRRQLFDF